MIEAAEKAEVVGSLGLELVAEIDMNSLLLGKREIIKMWDSGVLSPLAYVHLALLYERKRGGGGHFVSIDIGCFIESWAGSKASSGPKMLKPKQVLAALATLEEKELLEMSSPMIQLDLFGAG
jgi:hypothetical protein